MTAKDLKNALLQEAVQGKLVPQIAEEGNAHDLLKQIQEEKNHTDLVSATLPQEKETSETVRANKIRVTKKDKLLPKITEEEIPSDIPETWCWCRLGELGNWKAGSTPPRDNPSYYKGTIPWLKTGDLNDNYVNAIPEYISREALEKCPLRINPKGSVLIAMYGATIGKIGILDIEATTNQACCACICEQQVYNKYLFYYLMSQRKAFTEKAEGGAQPNISREKIVTHVFPLPPLTEQKRIVTAIEQLLPLCEKLGE